MDSEQKAYLAGWIASDGSIYTDKRTGRRISFCLKAVDSYILELFGKWTNSKPRYYTYDRATVNGVISYDTVHLNIWDKELIDWAIDHDLKNRLYGNTPIEQRRAIQGILEGDGHVSFRKKNGHFTLVFTIGNESLLRDILSHLNQYLAIPMKSPKLRKDNCYQISYEGRVARIIAWYLYRDAVYFLPRKARVVNKLFVSDDPIKSYINIILNKQYPQYIIAHKRGFMFRLYGARDTRISAKMVCKGFHELGINATPLIYGKGKTKYYGVYIPDPKSELLVYMQGSSLVKEFPGKIRILGDDKA